MSKKEPLTQAKRNEIANEIIDLLRPYHPAIYEIKLILEEAQMMLDYVVLREKTE